MLDDNIEMAKRLKQNHVQFELLVIDNKTPHGYLNLQNITPESSESLNETLYYLQWILNNFDLEKDIERSEFMKSVQKIE
jgi:acetyl esterase/lipase